MARFRGVYHYAKFNHKRNAQSSKMIITVTPNPVLDRTITVPELALNDVLRAAEVRLDWGGKGFNVSRALAAMEMPSLVMGFLGGATGEMLDAGLRQLGLETDFITVAGETRTNIVIAEPSGRHIKVNEAGPTVAAAAQTALMDALTSRLKPGDICVLAGSLPPGIAPDFYARLIRVVRAAGAVAVLDASGDALRLGVDAAPNLVKPNEHEAAQVTGRTIRSIDDAARVARLLTARGVGIAALSLGAEGLVLAAGERAVHAQPPRIREVINVGAGDAAVAGMVWALAQEYDLGELARWGAAFGAAAAAKAGVSFGTRAELQIMVGDTVCTAL